MMNTSKDISGKIDPSLVEVIGCVAEIANGLEIPFFIVGASARDIVFSAMYDIPTIRATRDIDVAMRAANWETVQTVISELLASDSFRQDRKLQHRFRYKDTATIDIVPFGELEKPRGSIQWPHDDHFVMQTIGFEEAYDYSVMVTLKKNPDLNIRVCAPPGLAILKLMAWHEMYPERTKDAKDLAFLMEYYIDAGNSARLYDQDRDIAEGNDFDYGLASPQLLGRDMGAIAGAETRAHLINILSSETKDDSGGRLAADILKGDLDIEVKIQRTISSLKHLYLGFQEGVPPDQVQASR